MLQLKKKKKEETWGSSTVKLVNYSSLFVTKGNLTVDCVFTGKHEVYRTKHTRHGQEWIYLMMSYYMLVVGHLQRVYTAVAFSLALVLVGGGGGCRERDSSTKQTNDQMSPSVRHVFLLVSKNIRLCPVYTSARCATILPGCGMYGSPPAHKSRICCCRFWTIEPIRNELCKSLFSRPPPPSVPFPIWSRAAAGRLHFFFMQRKPFDELHFFLSHFFREKTKHILSLFSSFGRWNNNNACIVHMQLILGETSWYRTCLIRLFRSDFSRRRHADKLTGLLFLSHVLRQTPPPAAHPH